MVLDGFRRPHTQASDTGAATAPGGVAISGINTGSITVPDRPIPRSDYLAQVRRIAPRQLLGRGRELAELASFCTASEVDLGYLWWRAPAWAGKSALMSWFVMNPPDGVRVVSFFITARYAGQSDRVAFADVVLEQLAELLGEPLPPLLTDATRDAHLLGMLTRAAEACQDKGERLVLVVDGLDEDRGVTTGPDAHSIAALLPSHPPAGMRVVVAGRPNPPIPTDVPDDHPLRDPRVVRVLGWSLHAAVVRQDAHRELKRLLHGSPAEQDLLGLLTAAGGGLSGADLAELTGWPQWEVGEHLGAVAGRTFTPYVGRWRPETMVYVLAHEELQQQATAFLGTAKLDAYRQRLHTWVEGYRERRWPSGTPEYLLRGYFRLLHAIGDLPRMLAYATDLDRHDRMLDITGGDAAALTEVDTTGEAIVASTSPDLAALARLAVHRDVLEWRNTRIPSGLPRLWGRLGHLDRAEALARSVTGPGQRVDALAGVAQVLAETGQRDRALVLIDEAEALTHLVTDAFLKPWSVETLAHALVKAGRPDRAEALIRSGVDEHDQEWVLSAFARKLADTGDLSRAVDLAHSIVHPEQQAGLLADVARGFAGIGEVDRAFALLGEAEVLARSIVDSGQQVGALADVVRGLARGGEVDRAIALLGEAEVLARSITHPERQVRALCGITRAVADAGWLRRAEMLARSISSPAERCWALVDVVRVIVKDGDFRHARVLAKEAEQIAHTIPDPWARCWALVRIAEVLVEARDLGPARALAEEAERLARSAEYPFRQAWALVKLVQALVKAGRPERAGIVVDHVETLTSRITDQHERSWVLRDLAAAVAAAGDKDRAARLAPVKINTGAAGREGALDQIAHALLSAADPGRVRGLIDEADALVRSIDDPDERSLASTMISLVLAVAGHTDRARTLIGLIADPGDQAYALVNLAHAVGNRGDSDRARMLIEEANAVVQAITDTGQKVQALTNLVRSFVATGSMEHARTFINDAALLVDSAMDADRRPLALVELAPLVAASGDHDRAEALARSVTDPVLRAHAVGRLVQAVAESGAPSRAEALARSITDLQVRAGALAHVAANVDPARAERLLAEALLIGYWPDLVDALAQIQPAAVERAADEVVRLLVRSPKNSAFTDSGSIDSD